MTYPSCPATRIVWGSPTASRWGVFSYLLFTHVVMGIGMIQTPDGHSKHEKNIPKTWGNHYEQLHFMIVHNSWPLNLAQRSALSNKDLLCWQSQVTQVLSTMRPCRSDGALRGRPMPARQLLEPVVQHSGSRCDRLPQSTESLKADANAKMAVDSSVIDNMQKQLHKAEAMLSSCVKSVEAAWDLSAQRLTEFDQKLSALDIRLVELSQKHEDYEMPEADTQTIRLGTLEKSFGRAGETFGNSTTAAAFRDLGLSKSPCGESLWTSWLLRPGSEKHSSGD